MKQPNLFSILLFTFLLLLLAPNLVAAAFAPEAGEIPYQINNSDHIVIGTICEIDAHDNLANNTITVDEWLYNPLPEKTIIVRSTAWAEDARFTQNETVLLMLNEKSPIPELNDQNDKKVFYVALGELGKHPVSDRGKVIEALKAQGKWKGEDQIGNQINETETINKKEITSSQKENVTENMTIVDGKAENTVTLGNQGESNTTQKSNKSNSTPFISPIWILAIVLMAVVYIKR